MMRRLPAVAAAGLALVLLSGCTNTFLAGGGGSVVGPPTATPDASDPAPEPTETEAPPVDDRDCGSILLNRPGHYVLGECGTVTVEGAGITVSFLSIAELVIRGDRADLVGTELGTVEISGQGSEISVEELRTLRIAGNANTVVVDNALESVIIDGNENVVTAGDIGSQIVNGVLNEVG